MRPRSLLVLLVVVLALGAFIWFYERKLPSSEERAEKAKKVLQLEKDDVKAVSIEMGGKRLDLERVEPPKAEPPSEKKEEKDGEEDEPEEPSEPVPADIEWRIARPLTARADSFAVDGLLQSLLSLEKTRTFETVVPSEVGLDKPQATVRLRTAEGEQVLRFGSKVPTGGSVIAALQGEPGAYVVSDSVLSELGKEPGSWRDHRLFHASQDAVQRINLNTAGQRMVLVKRGAGFRLESPVSDQADRERVNELFTDLTGLSAETFVDTPDRSPAEMGLQPPQATVDVAAKGKPALRIELGTPVEGAASPPAGAEGEDTAAQGSLLYARVGGQLVQARTKLVELAQRPAADWRSPLLSAFEVHQIDHVTVKDGQGQVDLERDGTDWKRGDTKISYVPVSDLLFSVTEARADRLLAPADLKLGPPSLTITLKGKDAGTETLTLYPVAAGQGTPARASDRNATLLLPVDKLKEIQDRLATVRKAEKLQEKREKD